MNNEDEIQCSYYKWADSRVNGNDKRLYPLRLGEAHQQRAMWLVESDLKLNGDYAGDN